MWLKFQHRESRFKKQPIPAYPLFRPRQVACPSFAFLFSSRISPFKFLVFHIPPNLCWTLFPSCVKKRLARKGFYSPTVECPCRWAVEYKNDFLKYHDWEMMSEPKVMVKWTTLNNIFLIKIYVCGNNSCHAMPEPEDLTDLRPTFIELVKMRSNLASWSLGRISTSFGRKI